LFIFFSYLKKEKKPMTNKPVPTDVSLIRIKNTPASAWQNQSVTKTIFVHMTENPQRITLNSDCPGYALMAHIMYVILDTTTSPAPPYCQIDFGQSIFSEVNQTFGAISDCIQIPLQFSEKLKIPIKFHSNHVPQWLNLTILGPGEPAERLTLGTNGCQIGIKYQFIPS
jgi:hypothetical protein